MKLSVCKRAAQADFLINVPVLKAHCQTYFTCALQNLKGHHSRQRKSGATIRWASTSPWRC